MEALAVNQDPSHPKTAKTASDSLRFGPLLAIWMALTVLINGGLWAAGFRAGALSAAVEQGAAEAESQGIGVLGDDLIRKAIRTQHDTLPFWTILTFIGDFLIEPLVLALRALSAATAFSAVAALLGRGIDYNKALSDCTLVQGFWVLGLAVRAALMVAFRRGDIETSAALFLPPGAYPALLWLSLAQLDIFAMMGWAALAIGAHRRRQAGWTLALTLTLVLALSESFVRVALGLGMGAAMRLSINLT